MENQLKKAIDIAKKTGDRIIVYDSSKSHPPYVVLSLDEYEKMTFGKSDVRGLTEDELLDKINRDIAIWKSEQSVNSEAQIVSDFNPQEIVRESLDRNYFEKGIEDDMDFGAEETGIPSTSQRDSGQASSPWQGSGQARKRGNLWRIPSDRKEGAEEVIEEDRQYLENIDL